MAYSGVLARPHLSIAGAWRTRTARPDPSLLQGVVAREVLEAMRVASLALKRAGVRHVVVGSFAVGANGFPRAFVVEFDDAVSRAWAEEE